MEGLTVQRDGYRVKHNLFTVTRSSTHNYSVTKWKASAYFSMIHRKNNASLLLKGVIETCCTGVKGPNSSVPTRTKHNNVLE